MRATSHTVLPAVISIRKFNFRFRGILGEPYPFNTRKDNNVHRKK